MPNTTIAQAQPVGWQPNSSRRGTFDIIESCAVTIFTCTWTIQHLNVPGPNDTKAKRFLRTCKWMVITILLPEFILAHAIIEFMMALNTMEEMRTTQDHNLTVAASPSLKALWDGFRDFLNTSILSKLFCRGTEKDPEAFKLKDEPGWTITHAYFANMGGFVRESLLNLKAANGTSKKGMVTTPVLGTHLAQCLDQFEPFQVSEDDIKDKGKSDDFAKLFAVLQILQLVLSVIVRHFRGLPFAQLETLTLAIAVCGVATWIAFWYKPRAISVPIKLERRQVLEEQDSAGSLAERKSIGENEKEHLGTHLDSDLDDGHGSNGTQIELDRKVFDSYWSVLTNSWDKDTTSSPERVPNDSVPTRSSQVGESHSLTYVLAGTSAAFAALHAIAWNFHFPTALEATMWRAGTILLVVVPPLGLLVIPISQITFWDGDPGRFLDVTVKVLTRLMWEEPDMKLRSRYNQTRVELTRIRHIHALQPKPNSMVLYQTIFCPDKDEDPNIRDDRLGRILTYVQEMQKQGEGITFQYVQQFETLVELMKGKGTKNMVVEAARTNVYPRKMMPAAVNLGIVYVIGIVYCIARLMVVGVGLSSLRSMPDGVYVKTWTDYIPSI
ncbi:hypothetical protein QBC40DRAFT_173105 [Triangularia verruculosa]|uniref:Uncharacterized protein n=1 Tax=Triangularia verruculosa TaxID=2587418 RepID=A0AAN7AW92_9PEZI|nr:hypothetical protein QBC40DRAFT_173105 [Triangularia verruculosa]